VGQLDVHAAVAERDAGEVDRAEPALAPRQELGGDAGPVVVRDQVAPPTINLEDLDDDVPVDVATEPRPLTKRGAGPMAVVNNAFGFGGHNVSLVFTAA